MVVLSLARLQHRDTQLVDAVLEKAIRRMDEAYTRDLAAVCKVSKAGARHHNADDSSADEA